ncbi:Ribosomal large subunit pseudouridine synthase D [Candidatus Portiera aleyrodidarum]|uniref:RluA family pseudouridine synthase n=1 Tax=Candidatus Portiera aleyrodidarum TaxID=91844 RepID=UPI0005D7A248|nr:RluA family pseudouridine synthase [Candidatus Portiera aleyrodidarum]CEL12359.1 Ribosomal large subunit pseudouridine synthase D [Candidatus Portiera aleyrodidarum]
MRTIKYIPSKLHGMRLDKASSELFNFSREKIKYFINKRKLIVDGFPAKPKEKINEGQCIALLSFNKDYLVEKVLKSEKLKIDIIYEDKYLMVINKKPGLVVHPSKGNLKETLVNAILNYNPELRKLPRAGLVHRIDKETSGLLIIAKTLVTYKKLIKQIKYKSIIREYDALVIGKVFAGGAIKTKIGRHFKNRKRKIVRSDGKVAITHYRVIEKFKSHTYIRCWLETGRTHQIRVHMDYINSSLTGDYIYFKKKILPNFNRQALHAHCLQFKHPTKNEKIKLKVKLPKDMKYLLNRLRYNNIYSRSKK